MVGHLRRRIRDDIEGEYPPREAPAGAAQKCIGSVGVNDIGFTIHFWSLTQLSDIYTFVVPQTLPQRRQRVLHRALSMFNSFGENIPRGLLDAIEALLAMQLGLEEETNLLEVILNRWARFH